MKANSQFYRNHGILKVINYFLAFAVVFAFAYPQSAHAVASITAISDTMSRLQTSQNSSHAIKFTTGEAVSNSDNTIVFTFPADFNFTGKTIASLTFTHGATTGLETTETINNGAPSATNWGGAFSGTQNRVLTLTAPTDGVGAAAVAASDKLIITYDNTNAANGSTATTYLTTIQITGTNPVAATSYAITLLTSDQVVVSTTIDPYISFTLTTNSVTLTKAGGGNPHYDTGGTGYNQGAANTLAANTNGSGGYTITYYGDTLKTAGGGSSIAAMAAKAGSSVGTAQFGLNLKDNATPNTGTDPSGAGTGAPTADYNTADQFKFVVNTATPLASAAAATTSNTYTVSYIVNVTATTSAGAYSSTITYICTGNF